MSMLTNVEKAFDKLNILSWFYHEGTMSWSNSSSNNKGCLWQSMFYYKDTRSCTNLSIFKNNHFLFYIQILLPPSCPPSAPPNFTPPPGVKLSLSNKGCLWQTEQTYQIEKKLKYLFLVNYTRRMFTFISPTQYRSWLADLGMREGSKLHCYLSLLTKINIKLIRDLNVRLRKVGRKLENTSRY